MLEANRNEIHEVYTLCRILGQGYLAMGTADGEAGENVPVALVERQDNDGPRRYLIEGDEVLVEGRGRFPKSDFVTAADYLLDCLLQSNEETDIYRLQPFFDAVGINDLCATTQD
ncbi:MAG: HpaII family restriction endonuclease, partial [Bacteroidaceae bacterium]|nr:HpaII family restriction endonuclease [Bacteroidaceae bacterium]